MRGEPADLRRREATLTREKLPMKFSERTGWNTEETDLARAYRARRDAGLPIADLTASNPTRCGFSYPPPLFQALADPRACDYDPQPLGLLTARKAVCDYYLSHNVTLDPNQIVLTASTSEAYSFLFRLLCDPGSEILVLHPGYPLFEFLADLDDVTLKAAPLIYDYGWQIDPEAIRRAISPRTRAIVVIHPNNPTGHFTKAWEAAELAAICREFDLSLIVDEVFLDYALAQIPGAPEPALSLSKGPLPLGTGENTDPGLVPPVPSLWGPGKNAGAPGPSPLGTGENTDPGKSHTFASGLPDTPVFVVSGLSKIAGLPQMKGAWIVATGPHRHHALARLEVIADTFLSVSTPVQLALPAWLAGAPAIQRQIQTRTAANLAFLDSRLSRLPGVERLAVEAGWYAILRVPALQPDAQTVLDLLDLGVWVHPGYFFGMPESGWLVISLLGLEFSHGVTALINYFEKHQGSNTKVV
jgi:alanine-synthesizing transaminase